MTGPLVLSAVVWTTTDLSLVLSGAAGASAAWITWAWVRAIRRAVAGLRAEVAELRARVVRHIAICDRQLLPSDVDEALADLSQQARSA